jgi:hypothetical protein
MKTLGYFLIILLCLISYSNTLNHSYAHDDAIVIVHNHKIKEGIKGIPFLFKNKKTQDIQDRYGYRPITLTTFALEHEFSKDNPKVNHLTNLLLYTVLCCLIYLLLLMIFKDKSYFLALFTTTLFIIHPIHTEVVANIKSRDELLMMLFGILACILFLKAKKSKRLKSIVLFISTLLLLVLSFLSRENGIIFIGILLLIYLYEHGFKFKISKEIILITAAFLFLIALRVFYTSDYFFENESLLLTRQGTYYEDGFLGNPLLGEVSWSARVPNALYILFWYLKLLIFPNHLVHDYGYGYSQVVGWSSIQVWLSIIIHLGLVAVVIWKWRSKSPLIFGILFYLGTIFLYLHLIQISPDYMAERYLFVPSLGFCLIITWLILSAIEKCNGRFLNARFTIKVITIAGASVLILALILKTRNRNLAWKNNESLYSADLGLLKNNARANYNYALMLETKYKNDLSLVHQKEILKYMRRSIMISERSLNIRLSYALKFLEIGNEERSITELKNLNNEFPSNIAAAKYLATIYIQKNQFSIALKLIEEKERLRIVNEELMYLKAICLLKTGDANGAYEFLKTATLLFPESSELQTLKNQFTIEQN